MLEADIERRSGIALWRQIADRIRLEIDAGAFDGKLSPEHELARRFGVNRHTVREAIASLVHERVLRSEQGRGTFIEERRRFAYPIGVRTRFSEGLGGQARELHGTLIGHAYAEASEPVAAALGLAAAAPVLRLETLGEADGRPISRATGYFDAVRFAGFEAAYARTRFDHLRFQGVRRRRLFPPLDPDFGPSRRRGRPRRPRPVAGRHRPRHGGDQRGCRRHADPVFRGALRRFADRVFGLGTAIALGKPPRPAFWLMPDANIAAVIFSGSYNAWDAWITPTRVWREIVLANFRKA